MKEFLKELRRRHIFRVALTYLVVAWLVIQIVNNLVPILDAPDWVGRVVLILLIAGFPVALVIAWAFDPPQKAAGEGGPRKPPVPPLGRKWDFVIIAGLVAALGYSYWGRDIVGEDTAPAPDASPEASVAVLPFANLSPDPDQEYFADGISEEILNSLAAIDDLQVAGRTSSFYFKGKDQDLRTIGEKLGVAHILEGSVRKAGNKVRITAQLINADTGYHLWSDNYDRTLQDIFAIQGEIAESVAQALQVTLGVGELGRRPGMTRDVEAYDAYLQGGPYLSTTIQRSYRTQIDALQRAVEIDPAFGLAWAEIARAVRRRTRVVPFDEIAELRMRREAALARAQALAPEAPTVLVESAYAAIYRRNWVEAERFFRKARARHDTARLTYHFGVFLGATGKFDEAIDALLEARRAAPFNPDVSRALGGIYSASGQFQKSFAELDRGDSIGAPVAVLRRAALEAALATGERGEIERRFDRYLAVADEGSVAAIDRAMRPFLDDPQGARAVLRRLYEDPSNARPGRFGRLARWAAYFGAEELALAASRQPSSATVAVGSFIMLWSPNFSNVRQLDGFKDYVREAGLVDYWRQTGWNDFCRPVGEDDFECE